MSANNIMFFKPIKEISYMNQPIDSNEKNFPKTREQLLNDFDLLDFTESDDDFNNELNHTLDDPELESLEKQLNEFNEQEVNKKLFLH